MTKQLGGGGIWTIDAAEHQKALAEIERLRATLARIKPLTERRHGTNYVGRMLAIERVITGALEAAPADETTAEQR